MSRAYSWTRKEVSKLFEDLRKAISENEPEYFWGTIATIPRTPPTVLEIIDGQQRLATITIFLAEMRNYLKNSLYLCRDIPARPRSANL